MPGKPITKNRFNELLRSGRNNSKTALHKSGKRIRFRHRQNVFNRPSNSNPTVYLKRHRTKSIKKNSTKKNSTKKKVLRPKSN